jgi:Tfp pilus assembly protein PilO
MIEMNLVRQLPTDTTIDETAKQGYGWIIVVLCLGLGVASWGWTQVKQQELKILLQEKVVQTQSLAAMHTTLNRLEPYQEERQHLRASFEEIHEKVIGKKQPMTLLHGVSQSLAGLDLWLDSVQMVDRVVELRGQSLALQEIGKYLDALEHDHVIAALPVVEILDQEDRDRGKLFSFTIRFVLGAEVPA